MESILVNCVYPAILNQELQKLDENKHIIATALLVNKHVSGELSKLPAFHEACRCHMAQRVRVSLGLERMHEFVRTRWAGDMLQAQLRTEGGTFNLGLNWEDARDVELWDDDEDPGIVLGALRSESLAKIAKCMIGPSAEPSVANLVFFNHHHSVDISLTFGSSTYWLNAYIDRNRLTMRHSVTTVFGTFGEEEIKLSINANGDVVCIGMYTRVKYPRGVDDDDGEQSNSDDDDGDQSDGDDDADEQSDADGRSIDSACHHLYGKITHLAPWITASDFQRGR